MAINPPQSSSYLAYLPAIFSEDPLLGRFLLAFEQVLTGLKGSEGEPRRGLEQIIAALLPTLFDPLATPKEFLEWLAGWVALGLRADWSEDQQRQFLAKVVPLYRRRGTKQNLIELLRIYTGLEPEIAEGGNIVFKIGVHSTIGVDTQINGSALLRNAIFQIGVHSTIGVDTQISGSAHYFRVAVTMPNPYQAPNGFLASVKRQNQIAQALIELEKPAHTAYDYYPRYTTMQIGVLSTIGVDILLGGLP